MKLMERANIEETNHICQYSNLPTVLTYMDEPTEHNSDNHKNKKQNGRQVRKDNDSKRIRTNDIMGKGNNS
jgi:hypothetical protein